MFSLNQKNFKAPYQIKNDRMQMQLQKLPDNNKITGIDIIKARKNFSLFDIDVNFLRLKVELMY